MNGGRGNAQPAAAQPHSAALRDARRGNGTRLFVPKNKEEQTFFLSSARVSGYFLFFLFLACTKISYDWYCKAETKKTEQGAGWGYEKEWNMCKLYKR